jgi:hypothetical protein
MILSPSEQVEWRWIRSICGIGVGDLSMKKCSEFYRYFELHVIGEVQHSPLRLRAGCTVSCATSGQLL